MPKAKNKAVLITSFVVRVEYTGPDLSPEDKDDLDNDVDMTLGEFEFSEMIREALRNNVQVPMNHLKVTCDVE